MTRARPFRNNFSSGELDPLLADRTDFQRHKTGLARCQGFLPLRQGGFTRAPGTIFRGNTKGDQIARRVPFEFAANDALVLEFTDLTMRVWRYGTLVLSGAVPYELVTPYAEADLVNLQWAQDADVIYLVDGVHPMQKLSRLALNSWTIADVTLDTGPFRVQNLDTTLTVQPSAATGAITIAGTGNIFAADWVGSLIRVEPTDITAIPNWVGNVAATVGDQCIYDGRIYQLTAGTNTGLNPPVHRQGEVLTTAGSSTRYQYVSDLVGIARITGYTDPNTVSATVIKTIPQPCIDDPTYRWSEGAWSARQGYPWCIEMWGQRLWAARTDAEPRTIWSSTGGLFEDFAPSGEPDGAIAYSIASTQTQNAILWLHRARKGIFIGALGEVYRGFSNTAGQVIGPTTFDTELVSGAGASGALPISGQGYPIHITRGGRRLQELRYSFEVDGTRPLELSLPSQHLGARQFLQAVWQDEPQRFAWIRAGDGSLVVMNYDPAQDVLGWAVVPVGGGMVEDIDVTSGLQGGTDVVSMVVARTVDGAPVRFIEEQALIYGVLTGAEPISNAVHTFASLVVTASPAQASFTVAHLIGEAVHVWTEQGEYGPLTVDAAGQVTLPVAVTSAVIGLVDASHFVETLDIEAPAPDGNSRGRKKRLHDDMGVSLFNTAAGYVAAVERTFGQPDYEHARQELIPLQVAADLTGAWSGVTNVSAITGYADAVRLRYYPYGAAPMTVTSHTLNIEEAGA